MFIAVEVLAIAAGLWMGWTMLTRPTLTVRVTDVSGFTEDLKVWMRFDVALEITNTNGRTIGIQRIDVDPDLDGFNEAYGTAVPFLSPPLLVQGNSTTSYTAVVTLLNAAQIPERTYDVVFRIRVETEDDDVVTAESTAQLDFVRDPARRQLRIRN